MAFSTPRLAFLLLFFAAASVHADGKVFRWTDAQGHVHYGDQPSATAQEVNPKAPVAGAAVPVATAAPDRAEECQRKKDQLVTYRGAAKITETDSLGETREFDDSQRQKLIEKTEKAVHDACGGG